MIEQVLSTEIVIVDRICEEEARHLQKQLETSELALQKFLSNQITFTDYLEILELCGVNIDNYLVNIENSLLEAGA